MNERQALALAHPLDRAQDPAAIARLRHVRLVGNDLLVVILAIDR